MRSISVFRADLTQVGDTASAPRNYANRLGLPWLRTSEVLDIEGPDIARRAGDISDAVVIVGGGGLGFTAFRPNLQWIAQQHPAALVWWGAGRNTHFGKNISGSVADSPGDIPATDAYPAVLSSEYFNLIGVRDVAVRIHPPAGYQWVPCVSAMHPAFDEDIRPTDEIRVYSHKDPLYVFGPELRTMTNASAPEYNTMGPCSIPTTDPARIASAGNAGAAIRFIRESSVLVTNTYHGAYWAQLAGVPVAVFAEFSTKFRQLPLPAPFVTAEDIRSDRYAVLRAAREIAASQELRHGRLLVSAREANLAFARQVAEMVAGLGSMWQTQRELG